MSALLGAIWTFLNSDVGMMVVAAIVGAIYSRSVKDDKRRKLILEYAADAFAIAERVGAIDKLDGRAKYVRFIEEIVNRLKANGQSQLSAPEMEALKNIAYQKAWLHKPLPLPRAVASER